MTRSAPAPKSLTVAQARERIAAGITPLQGRQHLAIRSALGRVLAEEIISPINVPPHNNSAMDGYAVLGDDLPDEGRKTLELIGESFAGSHYEGSVGPGQCVRIMTGAVIPKGTDTVIMQEHVERDGNSVGIGDGHRRGQNVRLVGEDLSSGQVVLTPGRRLTPADLGLLASLGVPEVSVYRRPRVAFFSTGDELRSLGEVLEEGQIYDSNRYTLHGMLTRLGVEVYDLGVIRDRREDTRDAFRRAAAMADVVITSGGVSVGEADFVKETLDEIGEVGFWKIAMKPGRPLAFGTIDQAFFFGLPGNPVSVMATFYLFAQDALRRLSGELVKPPLSLRLPTTTALRKRPGRMEFQRAMLTRGEDGELTVTSTGGQGSGILSSMSRADCFIILPEDSNGAAIGERVEVQPFTGMV
jgi:molybdopterin molybdotransferase